MHFRLHEMKRQCLTGTKAYSRAAQRRASMYDLGPWLAVAFLPFIVGAGQRRTSAPAVRLAAVLSHDTASSRARSLRRGIELGAEEAAHTLELFGDSLDLRYVLAPVPALSSPSASPASGDESLGALRRPNAPAAIVRAVTDGDCLTLTTPAQVPTVDIGCDAPEPTGRTGLAVARSGAGALPRRSFLLLHVRPPASYSARALDRIAGSLEGAQRRDGSRVEMWHGSLDRFGAEQLNQRFQRRFGSAMDSDAWAGWIAMKILAEAALRAHGTTGPALARALTDSKARFDGHKGRPLRFDATTGVLLQPLYVLAPDSTGAERVVAELPPGVK